MFSLLLRLKRRIKKLLKVHSATRQKYIPTVRSTTVKVLLLVGTSVLIGLLYPGEDLYNPLDMPRQGDTSPSDIIAPFEIVMMKGNRDLDGEKEMVRNSIPIIINEDTAISAGVYRALQQFSKAVDSLRSVITEKGASKYSEAESFITERFPFMSQTAVSKTLAGTESPTLLRNRLARIFEEEIYKVGVIQDLSTIPETRLKTVVVRVGGSEIIHPRQSVLDVPLANARLLTTLNRISSVDSFDVEYYYLIGRNFIQPNLRTDMSEYNRRISENIAAISTVERVVSAGDIIVRAGKRVSEKDEAVLREMARSLRSRATDQGWPSLVLPAIARILLVLSAFSILYLALYHFRPDMFRSNHRLFALFLVFALQLVLFYLAGLLNLERSIYLHPVVVLPIMVTVLFDAEVGIISTVVLAMLLGILHRFDFSLSLLTIVVGTVACFASREVRKRSHFYRIMLFVVLAYIAFIYLVENLRLTPATELLTPIGYGLLVGVISALLTIGLLPFFESIFGITTDITLLELSDLNHPLLKRLAFEAPGTYHHSISVGNLSEAAAKAINGNALLARVGTYYHDIGKIEIPEYFVENQLGIKSKHEELSPSMSALILSAHVKRGRLLGEEADIPDDVLNFIEEHHGTMVMSYFYNKAVEQGTEEVNPDKFRYPGPKPQVRETGIAMLADAVEAASRTLDDPKPARIHNLIQKIINDRFQSGELDECPLTLRDLARIREAFAQVLIGAFHHRVAYPKKDQ